MGLLNILVNFIKKNKLKKLKLSKLYLSGIDSLLGASKIYAISSYQPLVSSIPTFSNIRDSRLISFYDDLIFVASVCVGLNSIRISGNSSEKNLIRATFIELSTYKHNSAINLVNALLELREYIEKMSSNFDLETVIGRWILFRLSSHQNANSKLKSIANNLEYAKIIGGPILNTFYDFWQEHNK